MCRVTKKMQKKTLYICICSKINFYNFYYIIIFSTIHMFLYCKLTALSEPLSWLCKSVFNLTLFSKYTETNIYGKYILIFNRLLICITFLNNIYIENLVNITYSSFCLQFII